MGEPQKKADIDSFSAFEEVTEEIPQKNIVLCNIAQHSAIQSTPLRPQYNSCQVPSWPMGIALCTPRTKQVLLCWADLTQCSRNLGHLHIVRHWDILIAICKGSKKPEPALRTRGLLSWPLHCGCYTALSALSKDAWCTQNWILQQETFQWSKSDRNFGQNLTIGRAISFLSNSFW